MSKIAPCLWFDGVSELAARHYVAVVPDSRIDRIVHAPADNPSTAEGAVLLVEFTLAGQGFVALNGGPGNPHTDAISFQIYTDDQAETDRIWAALIADGGAEIACSWCRDRWGVRWQIVPRRMMQLLADPDPGRAARAFAAMSAMVKIDIAAIEAAAEGREA
ncbi:VOC family protein [Blastomonas fulva]|uniref:VOC family protein n=1 Tax=Blastomonas fulva TaxID=1550728 RepID=UPI003F6E9534